MFELLMSDISSIVVIVAD